MKARVRKLHLGLDARDGDDAEPVGAACRVVQQRGLADPRLAAHDQDRAAARLRRGHHAFQGGQLTVPALQCDLRIHGGHIHASNFLNSRSVFTYFILDCRFWRFRELSCTPGPDTGSASPGTVARPRGEGRASTTLASTRNCLASHRRRLLPEEIRDLEHPTMHGSDPGCAKRGNARPVLLASGACQGNLRRDQIFHRVLQSRPERPPFMLPRHTCRLKTT